MKRGMRRIAVQDADGTLCAALFLTRSGHLPSRDWIAAQLVSGDEADSPSLLAARPRNPAPDKGAIVCVCFDVGAKQILQAVTQQGIYTVEAVGAALNAGTNCGSCRPAIAKLIAEVQNSTDANIKEAAE